MRLLIVTVMMLPLTLAACGGAGVDRLRIAAADKLAPVIQYGATDGVGSTGVHTVMYGETLTQIAQRYHILPADVVAANALSAPFRLPPGARLMIPPPIGYKVKSGDTVFQIARLFNLSPLDIVATNHLRSPYQLRVGQTVRLPKLPAVNQYAAQEPVLAAAMPMGINAAPTLTPVVAIPLNDQAPVQVASLGGGMMVTPRTKPTFTQASLPTFPKARDTGRPFLKPVAGNIISGYGTKGDGRVNEGINISAPKGSPVRAAPDGQIVYVGDGVDVYGNLILMRHKNEFITAYAHLDRSLVRDGDKVKRGQVIGTVGSTGHVDRSQLHFEIRRGRASLDPKTKI